ncbi:MAG: hypothetical protein HFG56_11640 [Lachnospiraceae bacterium]|nr:hypothetical protein [Lachnospiraceae bacterium]
MKRVQDDKVDQTENLYRELVGTDDASLLKEMAEAEWQWEEEKRKHPEEAAKLEQEAEFDFELLMNRINVEGKKNISKRKYNHRTKWENQDVIREYKKFKRAAVIAAVLGVLLVGGGINSVARNGYQYMIYPEQRSENVGLRYNENIEFIYDELDAAYAGISQRLDIPVLMLHYIPEGLEFQGTKETEYCVIIQFDYKGNCLYLKEEKLLEGNTMGLIISDRNDCHDIWNKWLDKNLQLEENELENGVIEYSVALKGEDVHYYLCGIMEREEFVKVVENLMYY